MRALNSPVRGADLLIHEVALFADAMQRNLAIINIVVHHTSPKAAGIVFARAGPKLSILPTLSCGLGLHHTKLPRVHTATVPDRWWWVKT